MKDLNGNILSISSIGTAIPRRTFTPRSLYGSTLLCHVDLTDYRNFLTISGTNPSLTEYTNVPFMTDISQYRRVFSANTASPFTSTTFNMFSGNTFDTNKGTLQFGTNSTHFSQISTPNTNPINQYGTTRVGTFCVFGVAPIISVLGIGANGAHIISFLSFSYFNVAFIGATTARIYFNSVDYSLRNATTGITTFTIPFNITNGLTFTLCTFSANTETTVFTTYMSNTVTSPDLKYVATNTIFNHPTTGSTSALPQGVGGVPGTVTGVTYPISGAGGQIGWGVDTGVSFSLAGQTNSTFESFYANSYTTEDQAKLIHEYMMIKFRNKRFSGKFQN
jgi:hypothetical protein